MDQQIHSAGSTEKIDGFIFDLDGVVTDTQEQHASAWKKMFNQFLEERRSQSLPEEVLEDFRDSDYYEYLDGKPRKDGIKSFLVSRNIDLPYGESGDPEDAPTIEGLAKKKNRYYLELIDSEGVRIIHDTVDFIHHLREAHIPIALVSSSRNAHHILKKTGLESYFDAVVTPKEAEKKALKGKPSPDYFLEACKEIHKEPSSCAIVEDSLAGIEAGKSGGFQEVVGLDYHGNEDTLAALKERGADEAVSSLWDLQIVHQVLPLPNILAHFDEVFTPEDELNYFLFLDFDGTLSPIVDVPSEAQALDELPEIIQKCTEHFRVCIITGRDSHVIMEKLRLNNVFYAACHGFEITSFPNFLYQVPEAKAAIPNLDQAEKKFAEEFSGIEGFVLERKKFGIALHYRMMKSPEAVSKLKDKVTKYVSSDSALKVREGEKVLEILPEVYWDKGMAMLKIYQVLGIHEKDLPPLYIGDGQTDEDAFREMETLGIPILASIGQRRSKAKYHLRGPVEVRDFLKKLLERKSRRVYV